MRRTLIALTALAALAGCSAEKATNESPPTKVAFPAGFAPSVQTRIDGYAADKKCAKLQGEFDIADARAEVSPSSKDADLLVYIDAALRGAGCYS